jgi:methyl-accepting chemotaxis protein
MSIKTKLIASFSVVAILVSILSIYTITGIGKSADGFTSYREMARDSVLAGRVQANMLMVRMNVKDYLKSVQQKDIDEFNHYYNKTEGFVKKALVEIKNPTRAKMVKEIDQDLKEYKVNFEKVIDFMNKRNDIVINILNKNGKKIEQLLTSVMNSTQKDGDLTASLSTAKAIRTLLLARLYTSKFLLTNSKDASNRVHKEFSTLSQELVTIRQEIQNPNRKTLLQESISLINLYKNTVISIEKLINDRNDIINNHLDVIGPHIAKLSEDVKLSIKKDQDTIGPQVADINSGLQKASIIVSVIIVLIVMILSLTIPRNISNLIEKFQEGLGNFFDYLSRKTKDVQPIEIDGKNEIATMASAVNKNISDIKVGLEKDNIVIEEVIDIVNKAKEGFYTYNINNTASNPELERLRSILNQMLDITQHNIDIVTKALIEYGNAKYDYKVESKTAGNIASLTQGTNALGDSISEVLSMISNTSTRLSLHAEQLAATSEQLSASSTQQAASLEETAAAVEEITSAISATSQRTKEMTKIANDLKSTSAEDDQLAHKTGAAMEEIDKATDDIVNAITIIDQIAFQTNILSLNAAVEAATAGEAGKGFAVVAAEVRNLAGRSAEAANEIKSLVDYAQEKTKEGKDTADKMVESFNFLNDKVNEVTANVNEVALAAEEQMQGMEQINSAVNELDTSTQENANASEAVADKAMILSEIASHLIAVINRTQFDKSKTNQVCDVNLVFDTIKFKFDHIAFKEKNYADIGNNKEWRVETAQESKFGNWISTHSDEPYAQHQDWQALLQQNKLFHEKVQEYVKIDAQDKTNPSLKTIAYDIEDLMKDVFVLIDKIKQHKCENYKVERKRDQIQTKSTVEYHKEIQALKHQCVSENKKII